METINDNKLDSLTKRENERQLNLQKKKDFKDHLLPNSEKLEFFEILFGEKQSNIEALIHKSRNCSENELADHFNYISKEILALQKYVAASNIFLRNYDLQRCQRILQDLTLKQKQLEEDLLPKKKFSFKNKYKQHGQASISSSSKEKQDEVDFSTKIPVQKNICGVFNKDNEDVTMTNNEIFKKDITFENMKNCKIFLKGSPSTLHLDNLMNCQIFSGPVSTSIFAENCENCTLVIACQQLRLHNSRKVTIYLHVTSRAIMEDCKNILVAPYNLKYDGIEDHFLSASLDINLNNWRCIDDFNWLSEKHSPNWKEIEDNDMVQEWAN
ncbi:unnamed protein product [Phaedon cochleariae]|uniref:C-CAP/cofactor C-like domain-containing protein n=1 Tax=Phaedon cochleariae TaxID=80249 RepID=A0A9N9SKF0_PHACE|nr:unnamed protein product [Phaedon cochleariae]